jgi:hypothetical protein
LKAALSLITFLNDKRETEMPAKVFISCGQATLAEQEMADKLKEWFEEKKQGYTGYVATAVPTIPEVNAEILSHLKSSDYFLFINFERETVNPRDPTDPMFRRGSMYTNQELAVAVAFGFDKLILLNQESVRPEGILAYMGVNTKTFNSINEVLDLVQANVSKWGWENTFSRHLTIKEIKLHNEIVGYGDHTTFDQLGYPSGRPDRIAHIELHNGRADIAAINCAMRLVSIQQSGLSKQDNFDQGRLKAMGRLGYDQAIWPKSSGSFDLFAIHKDHYPDIYLHSENDILPRTPIIREFGSYTLTYEIYAPAFPKLTFEVHLDLPPTSIMDAKITGYSASNTL